MNQHKGLTWDLPYKGFTNSEIIKFRDVLMSDCFLFQSDSAERHLTEIFEIVDVLSVTVVDHLRREC